MTFKLVFDPGFHLVEHVFGQTPFGEQIMDKGLRQGEWGIILNLLGLLLGFAILSKIFEESGVPDVLPRFLPDDWKGPFILLVFVFILSSFLDNIAAALIGGTIALVVFKKESSYRIYCSNCCSQQCRRQRKRSWRYNNNYDVD